MEWPAPDPAEPAAAERAREREQTLWTWAVFAVLFIATVLFLAIGHNKLAGAFLSGSATFWVLGRLIYAATDLRHAQLTNAAAMARARQDRPSGGDAVKIDNLRQKLIARRHQLSLNQRQAAARMHATASAFNQLELGNRANPTVETLHDWARSLGGFLVIDVEFPEQQQSRPKSQPACRLESPSATTSCDCPNWRHCYLNEAEAS